jgi:hypothetical protein
LEGRASGVLHVKMKGNWIKRAALRQVMTWICKWVAAMARKALFVSVKQQWMENIIKHANDAPSFVLETIAISAIITKQLGYGATLLYCTLRSGRRKMRTFSRAQM